MSDRVPRSRYPWWVRFGLLGFPTRRAQWIFVWLSMASAVACIAFGLAAGSRLGVYVLIVGGLGFPAAAVLYWLVIRWVDRNGSWQ